MVQDFFDVNSNQRYTRTKCGGTWLEWQRITKIIPPKFLSTPLTKTNTVYTSEDFGAALEITVYYTLLYTGNKYRGSVKIPHNDNEWYLLQNSSGTGYVRFEKSTLSIQVSTYSDNNFAVLGYSVIQ